MRILAWISVCLGLLAIGYGAIVLRGILRRSLSREYVVKFLRWSQLASIAGLLPPVRHLAPIQGVCMLSVYCSGGAILAWLQFRLAGLWRPVFTFLMTTVLYLNTVSMSIQMFKHSALLMAPSIALSPGFEITQLFLAFTFAVFGFLAVRSCHAEWSSYDATGTVART